MGSAPPPSPCLCHNNNVNLSPCFSLAPFLSLFIYLYLVSINHGSHLHRRRQFAGHTKRVDNLKGKSSLLTEEGHGTANARASSCSVEHNASRWTRRAPRYRFRSVGGAQHYHVDPRPPDPRPSALHLTLSHVVAVSPPSRFVRLFVRLLIPGCFWDLLIGNINRMHEERQSRVNKPLKEPLFFLIFGLLLLQCFICLRYEYSFCEFANCFFNSLS